MNIKKQLNCKKKQKESKQASKQEQEVSWLDDASLSGHCISTHTYDHGVTNSEQ